ncbi:hypothetical protein OPKNFCMD_3311 [Methylobacterium crusticola]|uniref:Cupin type-2 domain-containing protein n=1 Tax=Methylobacterium crusticola TaxID=1697972 RepID=A0ABQ4QZ85_9HYPH|nr:cupin domain-containing protein [Methylobacterium crusticola]GJD50568.1 hypothetical protein OPKNFCMD_3311 [Methylobacterium crusticola]
MSADPAPIDSPDPVDMADLPVQLPSGPADAAAARARFFNSGNAFNIKLPAVPPHTFARESGRARDAAAPTGFTACDLSEALACPFPATTPLMLARYAAIAPGETLAADFAATGSIWYVIAGTGTTRAGPETLRWGAGDVLLLPGGPASHRAEGGRAVLWSVTNEPQLALDGALPPRVPVAPVHYPAAEIGRQMALLAGTRANAQTSGHALIFSSETLEAGRNILPTLTLSLNTLPPRSHQRAHRHNSAAVTLVLEGEGCHSAIDGLRCDWAPFATMVTPPGSRHSHHNPGPSRARFLIVQDGGLHYHARTMGFEFLERA